MERGFRQWNEMAQSPNSTHSSSWKFDFIFARGASKHHGARRSGGSDLVPYDVLARHGTHMLSEIETSAMFGSLTQNITDELSIETWILIKQSMAVD